MAVVEKGTDDGSASVDDVVGASVDSVVDASVDSVVDASVDGFVVSGVASVAGRPAAAE